MFIRKHFYLTKKQAKMIEVEAKKLGVSESEYLRRLLDK